MNHDHDHEPPSILSILALLGIFLASALLLNVLDVISFWESLR